LLPFLLRPCCSSSSCSQLGAAKLAGSKFDLAKRLLAGTISGGDYSDFLTTLCYDHVVAAGATPRM
jgi:hypothetical protein